jgi:hypothetical protein
VTTFHGFIQPVGKFALARECAMPFAAVVDKTADPPLRQLQVDQRQRRVGPGPQLDQLLDPFGLAGVPLRGKAAAGLADHVRNQCRRYCKGIIQPFAECGARVLREKDK